MAIASSSLPRASTPEKLSRIGAPGVLQSAELERRSERPSLIAHTGSARHARARRQAPLARPPLYRDSEPETTFAARARTARGPAAQARLATLCRSRLIRTAARVSNRAPELRRCVEQHASHAQQNSIFLLNAQQSARTVQACSRNRKEALLRLLVYQREVRESTLVEYQKLQVRLCLVSLDDLCVVYSAGFSLFVSNPCRRGQVHVCILPCRRLAKLHTSYAKPTKSQLIDALQGNEEDNVFAMSPRTRARLRAHNSTVRLNKGHDAPHSFLGLPLLKERMLLLQVCLRLCVHVSLCPA